MAMRMDACTAAASSISRCRRDAWEAWRSPDWRSCSSVLKRASILVRERSVAKGAVVPLEQVWRLAGPWYGDRLDEDWQPRTPEAMQRLLSDAGLTGEFWRV
jgi:hypothetical protein